MTENNTRIILEVAKAVGAHLELSDVLAALTSTLKPVVNFDLIGIAILEGELLRVQSIHIEGFERGVGESTGSLMERYVTEIDDPLKFPVSEHPVCETMKSGQPFICADLESRRRFLHDDICLNHGFRSYVSMPLAKQGGPFGSIEFLSREKGSYTAEQVQLLRGVSDMVSLAVANALAYEEIKGLKDQLQVENLMLQDEIVQRSNYEEIVGSSASLRRLIASIEKVAPTDTTVLINGETGTGKELVAHAIHRRSPRAGRALIKVNLAALPKELIASELFGHEKGAFTGAMQQRAGRFEAANGGTLFLDEIGELSPEMQVALLRVLQEKEFERIGGNKTIKTDVRVIAATNKDLQREVAEGRFRMDLYYRLSVFPLRVPPLRERADDIPVLVDYFASRLAARTGKRVRQVERSSLETMQAYSWPGNIRELQNVIERCVILADNEVLRLEPGMLLSGYQQPGARPAAPEKSSGMRAEIEAVLRETRGRVAGPQGAAVRLGVPVTTLESRIRKLKINKHEFHRN
ncbi:MAG: sigma 54-interacting transcriptional regulator [Acidobacteria bacterium]|nr:sigma 54-interacting transcriptional regulator [Acidobacteriota bacterium]